jgi:hypothetical protein
MQYAYPPFRGDELEGKFVGEPAYLLSKDKGDKSMLEKRRAPRGVAGGQRPQSPWPRAKARLLEV